MAKARLTTYELNQQGYKSIESLTDEAIQEKKQELVDWFEYAAVLTPYAGLLCREVYDFTVFKTNGNYNMTVDEIIDVLKSRGEILDIQFVRDGYAEAYQCWVRADTVTKEQLEEMGLNADNIDLTPNVYMYMLFDASDWVIDVK